MNQYKKCPTCGNKQLIIDVEEVVRSHYSAKTGKLIKKPNTIHLSSYQYTCRCGWYSEPSTHFESLPEVIINWRK